jgi:hypothetical protein
MSHASLNFAWPILLAIATMLTAPAASYADIDLGPFISLNADGVTTNGDYISYTNPGASGSVTTSSASASYNGTVESSVTATSSSYGGTLPLGTTGIYAQASASLEFYFEPVTTLEDDPYLGLVPVLFTAYSTVTAISGGIGSGAADMAAGILINSNVYISGVCAQSPVANLQFGDGFGACGLTTQSYTLNQVFFASQNEATQIVIYTGGTAGLNGYITGTVDPTIEIDPTWQYASDFTIEASPIPPSTVPEPSYALLLGAALLALLTARIHNRVPTTPQSLAPSPEES